jgi:hypothetical protein
MKRIDSKPGASLAKHCLLLFASACCVLEAAYLIKPSLDIVARLSSKTERIYFLTSERWQEYKQEIVLVRQLIHESKREVAQNERPENPPSTPPASKRCNFSVSRSKQCAQ